MSLLSDLTLILLAALAGGFVAKRLGQPLIVGYILAGVLIGRFTSGLMVANAQHIEQLAELGVALLLFSLGLELSFRDLAPVRAVALGGATIQIGLTMALGGGLAIALGWDAPSALWFGALISLSSTMVALKTIQAQGRLGTLSSRVMLGVLVVQDLAVVPLMILLPELTNPEAALLHVLPAALRAFGLLVVIVLISTRVVPRLLAAVARWNSRELFLLATTTLAFGVGYLTWRLGLSLAIGAFVAGLVVNESEYAHQALSDIAPLRDLFAMLFFVSVGLLLDPAQLWAHLDALAIVIAAVLLGKALVLGSVVRLFGYRNVVPYAVGLTLFQVGEFAFVLAREGLARGAISTDLYALTLNTAIATMAVTPAISGLTPRLYARFRPKRPAETLEAINLPAGGLADHVIVAGSGRVGRSIADALSHLRLPCVLVEIDDRRVRQARLDGRAVIYGDAGQRVVLQAAAIDRARAMLVTVPTFSDVRGIVFTVKALRPDLPIVARADGPAAVQALYGLGIQEVASPEFEAAIEMTRQALAHLNVPADEILQVATALRRTQYGLEGSGLAMMAQIADVARQLEFTWLGLPPGSAFVDRTIGELRIRTALGVSVVGIIHDGRLVANPDPSVRFEAGDLVAVLGTRDQIARFEAAARANRLVT
jgi:CPA2 family monovalent cation:H+ antiporter-2